jgi:hypothetical protein
MSSFKTQRNYALFAVLILGGIIEIARQYGLHPNQIAPWKKQATEQLSQAALCLGYCQIFMRTRFRLSLVVSLSFFLIFVR